MRQVHGLAFGAGVVAVMQQQLAHGAGLQQ